MNAALQKSLTGKTPDQVVAALNRATAAQNKAADKLPGGLAQTLQNQADRSNALAAASSSTAKLAGDVATMFQHSAINTVAELEAKRQQHPETWTTEDQQKLDAALQNTKDWGEGGVSRALLHGATQGVLAWIGGGYSLDAGLRGAGGAAMASLLAPQITREAQKLLNQAGLDNGDVNKPSTLASLIGELAVTGFSSAFGGMAGVTAASVDINNRQLHPDEVAKIRSLARDFAKELFLTGDPSQQEIDWAEGRLMAQALRIVDQEFHDARTFNDIKAQDPLWKNAAFFDDGSGNRLLMFAPGVVNGQNLYYNKDFFAEFRNSYANDYYLALANPREMRYVSREYIAASGFIVVDTTKEMIYPQNLKESERDAKLSNTFTDTALFGTLKGVENLPTGVTQSLVLGPYGPQLPNIVQYSSPEEAQFGGLVTSLFDSVIVARGMGYVEASIPEAASSTQSRGLLTDQKPQPLLLEGPNAQGVGSTTIYGDTAGNVFVGKLPPEAGTQPIEMPPARADQLTAFRNVEVIDSSRKPVGEIDRVTFDPANPGNNIMIEDKNAIGLQNPLNTQTEAQWAQKQIYDKTVARIDALDNTGIETRSTKGGTPVVPTLNDLQTIKNYQFQIDSVDPALQAEVNKQVQALNAKFPNLTFSAKFGK